MSKFKVIYFCLILTVQYFGMTTFSDKTTVKEYLIVNITTVRLTNIWKF